MKTIKITSDKKISDIKKEFNDMFPFLKLEFFNNRRRALQGSLTKDISNTDLTLNERYEIHGKGGIVLKENMKVSELENLFRNIFGISAQVFRKSAGSWIETTVTDDWTLKHQNDEGNELSALAR